MRIIQRRERKQVTTYARFFEHKDCPGAGFIFDCDQNGNLLKEYPNYSKCLDDLSLIDRGVEEVIHRWTEPTIIECHCGGEVELTRFTNTCHQCQLDYNMSGQELAPREQWGEETGESLSDILNIDACSTDDLLEG